MSKRVMALIVYLSMLTAAGFRLAFPPVAPVIQYRSDVYKGRIASLCSPDWSAMNTDSLAALMVPLPGWGNYSWNIHSTSDSAQFYFNQGINMYYAFHIIESMASFKKAASFDPANGLVY